MLKDGLVLSRGRLGSRSLLLSKCKGNCGLLIQRYVMSNENLIDTEPFPPFSFVIEPVLPSFPYRTYFLITNRRIKSFRAYLALDVLHSPVAHITVLVTDTGRGTDSSISRPIK